MDKVKPWLELNWEDWLNAPSPPPWFTTRLIKRITKCSPPDVLPTLVLRSLAEKYPINDGQDLDLCSSGRFSNRASSKRFKEIANLSSNSRPSPSRNTLVRREIERRARLAYERRKGNFMWTMALVGQYFRPFAQLDVECPFSLLTLIFRPHHKHETVGSSAATQT